MNRRHTQILDLLTENGKMEVVKLSELLEVSQVTIRKDLMALEKSGIVSRIHGYACINDSDDINARLAYHYDIKQKIALLASTCIHDGETVMIESGSCCALLAHEIVNSKKNITIITNSAFIADYVRKEEGAHIILLGGEYQKESQVMVGPMVRRCVESFYVDKLFIGIDGYSEEAGFTGNDYKRSEAVKDLARQASKVMIVSDSSKFHQLGLVNLVDISKVDTLFTDESIDPSIKESLKLNNVNVQTTKKEA